MSSIRVRMAPSPTGFIHIGNLRSALYNELFARKHKGKLLLRIEDTDRSRYVPGAAEAYCRSIRALGLEIDEGVWVDESGVALLEKGDKGPYFQSKRQQKHFAYAQELIEKGFAYPCFCSESELTDMREKQMKAGLPTGYDGRCRSMDTDDAKKRIARGEKHVIRLAVPKDGEISFTDEIRGEVKFQWKQVDDQVIIKSDGMPTYHLAATCDDHDMEISHVIRGEEWLSSTPKHLFIYECFGWKAPKFAHLPLLLNSDRSKLSKRQGDVAVEDYLAKGYLPQTLLNFIALLGWNPTGDREIYSHKELCEGFDLSKVNKSGAIVNFEKLDWMNGHYLKELDDEEWLEYTREELRKLTHEECQIGRIAKMIRERVTNKTQIVNIAKDFIDHQPIDIELIPWKEQSKEDAGERLEAVLELLTIVKDDIWESPTKLEEKIKKMIEDRGWGNGEVLWPLRTALSAKQKSPPPFDLLYVRGKEQALERLKQVIGALRDQ